MTLDQIEKNNEFGEVIEFSDFYKNIDLLISFFNADKKSIYDFFGVPDGIDKQNEPQDTIHDERYYDGVYYYIPKMVVINMEEYKNNVAVELEKNN